MMPRAQRHAGIGGLTLHTLHWPCPEATEPPALLVHGLGDNAWVWQGLAPSLATDREVWAVDLRGHGGSDHAPPGQYSVAAMAQDLLSLVDALALPRPWLVGHSLGAAVSISAAAAAPQRFSALALVDYAVDVPPSNLKLIHTVLRTLDTCYPSIDAYAELLRRRHLLAAHPLLDSIAAGALRPVEGGYRPRFDPAVLTALCSHDSLGRTGEPLSQLRLPVCVVRGALSSMVSTAGAQQLAQSCPGASLAVVPMAGHSVQIDNPVGLLKALRHQSEPALSP